MAEYRLNASEVLDRVDVARLLDEVTFSNNQGGYSRRWSCPDPAHPDRKPSVSLTRSADGRERWKCWSQDHGGDGWDLAQLANPGMSKKEALEWLAERVGIRSDMPLPPARPRKVPKLEPPVPFSPMGQSYVRRCAAVLRGPQGKAQREWLERRGISLDVAAVNLVGADPGSQTMPRQQGLPAGIVPGVTFPAFNVDGSVCYVQLRSFPVEDVAAEDRSALLERRGWVKYDNPSRSVGANPRLSFQRPVEGVAARSAEVLVVTEGIPDALIATGAGFRSVAVMGNQTPDAKLASTVANYATSQNLTVAMVVDNDPGGDIARKLLTKELTEAGIEPVDVVLPPGQDLNDVALARPESWADGLETQLDDAANVAVGALSPQGVVEVEL